MNPVETAGPVRHAAPLNALNDQLNDKVGTINIMKSVTSITNNWLTLSFRVCLYKEINI